MFKIRAPTDNLPYSSYYVTIQRRRSTSILTEGFFAWNKKCEVRINMPRPASTPNLWYTVKLRCPYCGATSLLRPGNPLEFVEGCTPCNYRYEREIGYFSGASWMITYAVAAVSAMLVGGFMIWNFEGMSDLAIAGVPAAFGGLVALLFIPLGRALWMYMDHKMHPLTDDDCLHPKS